MRLPFVHNLSSGPIHGALSGGKQRPSTSARALSSEDLAPPTGAVDNAERLRRPSLWLSQARGWVLLATFVLLVIKSAWDGSITATELIMLSERLVGTATDPVGLMAGASPA